MAEAFKYFGAESLTVSVDPPRKPYICVELPTGQISVHFETGRDNWVLAREEPVGPTEGGRSGGGSALRVSCIAAAVYPYQRCPPDGQFPQSPCEPKTEF